MINKFLSAYQKLNKDTLHILHDIYTDDVVFIDPAHKICGVDQLSKYFKKLYRDIDSIVFEYTHQVIENKNASIYWTMTFVHPKIKNGSEVIVQGNTLIRFDAEGKVYYHQDCFDLGSMLYEHLPIIGKIISYAKRQLTNTE